MSQRPLPGGRVQVIRVEDTRVTPVQGIKVRRGFTLPRRTSGGVVEEPRKEPVMVRGVPPWVGPVEGARAVTWGAW